MVPKLKVVLLVVWWWGLTLLQCDCVAQDVQGSVGHGFGFNIYEAGVRDIAKNGPRNKEMELVASPTLREGRSGLQGAAGQASYDKALPDDSLQMLQEMFRNESHDDTRRLNVFGSDDRLGLTSLSMDLYPYTSIGVLYVPVSSGSSRFYFCTAFVVAKHLVVTHRSCLHIVESTNTLPSYWWSESYFLVGLAQSVYNYKVYFNRVSWSSPEHDFAILETSTPIGTYTGFPGQRYAEQSYFTSANYWATVVDYGTFFQKYNRPYKATGITRGAETRDPYSHRVRFDADVAVSAGFPVFEGSSISSDPNVVKILGLGANSYIPPDHPTSSEFTTTVYQDAYANVLIPLTQTFKNAYEVALGRTDPSSTKYPTNYPTTKYPTTKYPTTKYPTTKYPTTKYPTTRYPTNYPTTKYPTNYPTTKYPTKYPTTEPTDRSENANLEEISTGSNTGLGGNEYWIIFGVAWIVFNLVLFIISLLRLKHLDNSLPKTEYVITCETGLVLFLCFMVLSFIAGFICHACYVGKIRSKKKVSRAKTYNESFPTGTPVYGNPFPGVPTAREVTQL